MYPDLQNLSLTVQKNCHIADAMHAGDDTLCIYLLKMREFFRWENRQPYNTNLNNDDIGAWLREREALWEALENENFSHLAIDNQQFEPFDSEGINARLLTHELVYSGGLGWQSKPHFFLARLLRREDYNGFKVLISDKEYARDLSAPPAMTQGTTIYIRRESLQHLLWQKVEEWRWNKPDNAMGRSMGCYDFDNEPLASLEQMTDNELEAVLLHEIGEIQAGQYLGEAWESLLLGQHSKMEIMLRAVRDHFADALSTLPKLLEKQNLASLHFYFANLNNMRKHLSPSLVNAYETWNKTADLLPLHDLIPHARQHWQQTCEQVIQLAKNKPGTYEKDIIELIENSRL